MYYGWSQLVQHVRKHTRGMISVELYDSIMFRHIEVCVFEHLIEAIDSHLLRILQHSRSIIEFHTVLTHDIKQHEQ